ncbi:hypothetical protein [uncultured Shewanella sp.]|uniref:hypothetical protein n=1 Tax=uncultured Shewanella sp. TaxID=173975 RepID=UPI00262D8F2E|nr:hypothetical protein [uncultured Shewanella sp.]
MRFKYYVTSHANEGLIDPKRDNEFSFKNPVSKGDFISLSSTGYTIAGQSSGRVIDIEHTTEYSVLKVKYA